MSKHVIEALSGSAVYREYAQAFGEATGLPVALRSVESWQLTHHGKHFENPFCAMIAEKSRSCAACLQVQQRLSETATHEPRTVTCQAGLSDIAVPVRVGDQLIGFLSTGQVFCKPPTEAQFDRTLKQLADWGVPAGADKLREAYFNTRVLTVREHGSTITLLTIFAQHLAILSHRILVRELNNEPPAIARAKQFINEHHTEILSLNQVAKAVNMSSFYFCKLFKKFTGRNYTDYVARVRIEKSRNLLLNPNLHVSEIAYEVGFQSLTHFNRVFKRVLGRSPTAYRLKLGGLNSVVPAA